MKTEKKLNTIFLKSLSKMIMLILLMQLAACIQTPSTTRKPQLNTANSTNATNGGTKLPTFTEGNNFIQNGGVVYTSSVALDLSFSDIFQLRGKDVDNYIRNNGTSTITCLVSRFTDDTVKKVIILAAMPQSFYNFSTKTLEYYYNIAPADETANKNFCQKSGLINKLYDPSLTLTPVFKFSALCPSSTCLSTQYNSQPLELYAQSGTAITQVATRQLSYVLTNRPDISTPTGNSCSTNSECTAQGYSCCSLGQCVKDLSLKPNVSTSSNEYLQALQDILNNPNNIYLYPQYYYFCAIPASNGQSSGTTTPATTPEYEAAQRLKNLENLYNCTNKVAGEMGICTVIHPNATTDKFYSAGDDDRNFSSTYTNSSTSATQSSQLISIQSVYFGDVELFNYDKFENESLLATEAIEISDYLTMQNFRNEDVSFGSAAQVKIKTKPASAKSNDLVIKYKVDASCTKVNTSLAKCEKYYVQGQEQSGSSKAEIRRSRITNHYPSSSIFKLPFYADMSKNLKVEVDGLTMNQGADWQVHTISPPAISFLPNSNGGLRVYDTQKVKITFFVRLDTYQYVMSSKTKALEQIQTACHCADTNCSLRPLTNSSGTVIDYACVYPDPAPVTPPISQLVYLSAKNVPVRLYDKDGIARSSVAGLAPHQEGELFSYRKDDLLNPSNLSDTAAGAHPYVGFNEIYGSFSTNANSAKPAKEVAVLKGKTYDIYVDNGSYSNCIQCGNDYYSQLNKLFPTTQFGGGIVPLQSRTSRTAASGIRADDFSFGRACFVPATMIPWTHAIESTDILQRQKRMRAQHFMYANGYQRDWFGFDYGAVIGSFDGVKWFAIGSNRRIKADTNKLFLAVNGPFGDLALENTFTVTINDASLNPVGTNMIATDFESDGAQCQKFHQCSTDNDCATTLGWDYVCTSVNDTTTSWPRFDDNAKEIPDVQRDDNRLTGILGISTVGKRCVYRGRGSACTQNYLENIINVNSTFNQAQDQSQHTCSANNYCQPIMASGTFTNKFNRRIARYGKVRIDSNSDSFGLGAKVTGRPLEFNAEEPMDSLTASNFNSNKIAALCIPGRNPEASTFVAQNSTTPSDEFKGDKILGIGMTYAKNETTPVSTYLSACSITDDSKNYFYAKGTPSSSNASNNDLIVNSGAQAISTNTLNIFKSIFGSKGLNFGLYINNSTVISSLTFTENRCMRAPGASCFSDLDCAPSKVIADRVKMISAEDTAVTAILNPYEVKFWQEELICSQPTAKSDASYSPKNNRCCRDVGKTISIATADELNGIKGTSIPGLDITISDRLRYSRVSTVYKDLEGGILPGLSSAVKDQCNGSGCVNISTLTDQFKTFSAYAERTSCTGDWIRNFEGGNHKWDPARLQSFAPAMFKCYNWLPADENFSCKDLEPGDPMCRLIQTTPFSGKAKAIMNHLAKMELMGIPQIAIESEEFFNGTAEEYLSCRSFPTNQNGCYPGHPDEDACSTSGNSTGQTPSKTNYAYPPQLFVNGSIAEYVNSSDSRKLYSAADLSNFPTGFKKIFKSDEVSSCYAAGTTMPTGADANLCCTGYINAKNNKCQLPDFVDVSVYTNRYVSSEAKKLNASLFDANGYIRDPSYVALLACEKKICASNTLAYGVLVSPLKVPGQETAEDNRPYRFLEGATADDSNGILSLYNKGLKLNTHAYCFPANSTNTDDLTIISCGN